MLDTASLLVLCLLELAAHDQLLLNKMETAVLWNADQQGFGDRSCGACAETSDQISMPQTQLEADRRIEKVFKRDQAEAFSHFEDHFKISLLIDNLTADRVQQALRVLVVAKEFAESAAAHAESPGVMSIRDQHAGQHAPPVRTKARLATFGDSVCPGRRTRIG